MFFPLLTIGHLAASTWDNCELTSPGQLHPLARRTGNRGQENLFYWIWAEAELIIELLVLCMSDMRNIFLTEAVNKYE